MMIFSTVIFPLFPVPLLLLFFLCALSLSVYLYLSKPNHLPALFPIFFLLGQFGLLRERCLTFLFPICLLLTFPSLIFFSIPEYRSLSIVISSSRLFQYNAEDFPLFPSSPSLCVCLYLSIPDHLSSSLIVSFLLAYFSMQSYTTAFPCAAPTAGASEGASERLQKRRREALSPKRLWLSAGKNPIVKLSSRIVFSSKQ